MQQLAIAFLNAISLTPRIHVYLQRETPIGWFLYGSCFDAGGKLITIILQLAGRRTC